jgi:NAD(P)-dependent dehydrogenase (short-subunit alcohol dehydrogenase family)
MGLLDGKVIVVTGAGRGLGRCHAELLAHEGAAVVVNDLGGEWDGSGADERPAAEVAEAITAVGGNATPNFDSVSSWEGARRMVDQAVATYGRLDGLVCNAGFVRDRTVFNMSEDEWDQVIDVHLKGHFAPTRWATAHWRERFKETGEPTNAAIVYTASEAGLFGNAGQPNYSAAKAGIASLGIVVAREMHRYGVTCNTVNPRGRTRMTINTFGADKLTTRAGEFDANDPANVSPWIAYLCSDHATDITGQTFVVGGDTVALMEGWHRVNRIRRGKERWTPAELVTARAELFADRPTDVPKFSM